MDSDSEFDLGDFDTEGDTSDSDEEVQSKRSRPRRTIAENIDTTLRFHILDENVIRIIHGFADNFNGSYVMGTAVPMPDDFWEAIITTLGVRRSAPKNKRRLFERFVLPRLCGGCGKTVNTREHCILDARVCRRCEENDDYKVISKTKAVKKFHLPIEDLPEGVLVQTRRYDCTMYLLSEVMDAALAKHGSWDAIKALDAKIETRRLQRKQRAIEAEERRNLLDIRRQDAIHRRLEEFRIRGDDPNRDMFQTNSFQYVLGDLETHRIRVKTTAIDEALLRLARVRYMMRTCPNKQHRKIGTILRLQPNVTAEEVVQQLLDAEERRKETERVMNMRTCTACSQTAAAACPNRQCRSCCPGCIRHR